MTQALSPQRPRVPAATMTTLFQRLVAAGYDRLFDHVDPCGADRHRRLVEQASGEVLGIGGPHDVGW